MQLKRARTRKGKGSAGAPPAAFGASPDASSRDALPDSMRAVDVRCQRRGATGGGRGARAPLRTPAPRALPFARLGASLLLRIHHSRLGDATDGEDFPPEIHSPFGERTQLQCSWNFTCHLTGNTVLTISDPAIFNPPSALIRLSLRRISNRLPFPAARPGWSGTRLRAG